MRNAGLEEAQAGIKIAGRNINNLRYADDTTLMAESKEPRSALESRRVSLGAHWVDSRESSLLRRLERGREIGR